MSSALDWELIGLTAFMAALIGAGMWAIARVKRWHREAEEPADEITIDTYRTMLDEGTLDDEEFQRIRARLEAKCNPEAPPDAPVREPERPDDPPQA
jgi:hypothetical protein